jgi:hypothetical protein
MFQITQDPSSGSDKLYLTKITDNGSIMLGCVHTTTCTIEPLSVILVKYILTLPDDASCVIRNMLE